MSSTDCRNVAGYVASYLTKQALSTTALLPLIKSAIISCNKQAVQQAPSEGSTVQQRARKLVIRCLMKMVGHVEVPTAQAFTTLLGLPVKYMSHTPTNVPLGQAVSFLTRNNGAPPLHLLQSTSNIEHSSRNEDAQNKQAHDAGLGGDHNNHEDNDPFDVDDDDVLQDQSIVQDGTDYVPVEFQTGADGQQSLQASGTLRHYVHRPEVPPYSDMSMLQFYSLVKIVKGDYKSFVASERNNRAELGGSHPQHDMYLAETRKEPYIPNVIGPAVPKRNLSDPSYCALVLILCKPWRTVNDILGVSAEGEAGISPWCQAMSKWYPNGIASLDKFHANYFYNLELRYIHEKSR